MVIMPGEALVVNLAGRPTRCEPRCRALWYEAPGRRPDPRADDFETPPARGAGKPSTCAAPAGDAVQAPSDRGPLRGGESERADACDGVGMPCAQCNSCGGINEPPDISRSVMQVMIDAKNSRRH